MFLRPEYSPETEWKKSPASSVAILQAEVSRLERKLSETIRAMERAHRQVKKIKGKSLVLFLYSRLKNKKVTD